MATALQELNEKISAKQNIIDARFKEYPDFKMPAEVASEIKQLNLELQDLGKERDQLNELEVIRAQNEKALKDRNTPANGIAFGGAGNGAQQQGAQVKSLAEQFTDSVEFKQWGRNPNARFEVEIPGVSLKTVVTTSAGFAPANPRTDLVVPFATYQPVVSDLIPQYDTQLSVISYMEQTTYTNNAGNYAEGADRSAAESAVVWTQKSNPVELITVWIPVTNIQLEDVPGIQQLINENLTLMLKQKEGGQILSGTGTTPELKGFLGAGVTIQSQASAGAGLDHEAFFKAMQKVRNGGFANPTGMVMYPDNWTSIRLMRTAEGIYIWGDPADPGVERLWGLPVVQTQELSAGTGLVGDFRMFSRLARRQGLTVRIGEPNDYMLKGQKAIMLEERVAMEIHRPNAFCKVTGLS